MKKKPDTLHGHYAGFMTRFLAFFIDIFVLVIAVATISYALSLTWKFFQLIPNPIANIIGGRESLKTLFESILPRLIPFANILIIYGYFVFFWTTSGQTIGKALMGVRVVSVSGRPLTFMQAFFRILVFPLSAMAFGLGFFWILIDNQRQAWHDTFARTYVIYSWEAVPHPWFLSRQHQENQPTE